MAATTHPHGDHAALPALPALPAGWRHAGVVERIARQPRERRETILAGAFALAAALWAPLGVLAFLSRNALLFGLLSLVAAVVAVAPRPATSSGLATLEPALASVRQHTRSLVARLPEAGQWLQGAAHRVSARARAADQRISAAVRSGLEDLSASGGRDHSTPSSAR